MLSPLTPSSALSTSRSPSRRARVMGRSIGLASPICARSVGLDSTLAEPKLCRADQYELDPGTIGDDAPECTPFGIGIGIGMERRGAPPDNRPLNASRRCEIDGETARRFAAEGYGSYRSSTVRNVRPHDQHPNHSRHECGTQQDIRFRLLFRTALVDVGGGVYRHVEIMGEDTADDGCMRAE